MNHAATNKLTLARQAVADAGLYLVPKDELVHLAEVAADSFLDYPLHTWFVGGRNNPALTRLIMEASLLSMAEEAVIYADSAEMNGFAVWTPPHYSGSKTLPFLKNGGLKLLLKNPLIILRLLTYEGFAMNLKKQQTGHQDWYLFNLSVRRSHQGQGIASILMEPMLELIRQEQAVAYLETNKNTNVPIYTHYGFDLLDQTSIPRTGIPHYTFVYTPGKPAGANA